jgi:hypothetical protein
VVVAAAAAVVVVVVGVWSPMIQLRSLMKPLETVTAFNYYYCMK